MMELGPENHEAYATGVVIASNLFLFWYLFGAQMFFIFVGFIALGIVLNHTPSPKPKPGRSRKTQPLSPSSHSKLASEAATAYISPKYTRRDVVVIPDSPVSFQPLRKRRSKHLADVQRSLSFDGEL
jgi:hypothetical protein